MVPCSTNVRSWTAGLVLSYFRPDFHTRLPNRPPLRATVTSTVSQSAEYVSLSAVAGVGPLREPNEQVDDCALGTARHSSLNSNRELLLVTMPGCNGISRMPLHVCDAARLPARVGSPLGCCLVPGILEGTSPVLAARDTARVKYSRCTCMLLM